MHRYTVYNVIAYNINSYLSVMQCVKICVYSLLCLFYVTFLSLLSEYVALISAYIFTMILISREFFFYFIKHENI